MAYYTRIICFILIIFNAAEPKWIRPMNINETHGFKYKFNKIKISAKEMTIINDNNKDIEAIINKTDHPVSLSDSEKKCEIINHTEKNFEVKHVESIRLDNMNSVTVNLIKDKVSIDDIEVDGVNLFAVVNSNCGSAKVCPNFRANWTVANTVTIGFLSAYGWSQRLSQSNGLVVTAEHRFPDYIPRHISRLESIVDQTYDKTRVYVFLGEHIALVDFVHVLQRRGLLEHGEYAVVAVDDEIYDPSDVAITHADYLIYNSSSDVLAFRAVLKLTPSYPTNPHYLKLCQMIRKLSAAPPFCVPNYHKIFDDTSVPIEAAHLYDAVTLWARAATAATQHGLALTDGATLMRLLRPTTYRSLQGFDVRIARAKRVPSVQLTTDQYVKSTKYNPDKINVSF